VAFQTDIAARLCIAALVGLAAGLEREWSGHATGPDARFAGVRTFFLLGALGGIVGVLAEAGHGAVGAALGAGAAALCVAGYVAATRRPGTTTDGTTETAALAVVALGVVAGLGVLGVAAAAGAVLVLMLREKERLHSLIGRMDERELRAGMQFAVLAVVVLPLLPAGPFLGSIALRPRSLWIIVLFFSALNFAGFIARRIVGASRGLGITGALGGIVSSTAVTLNFSRRSRIDASLGSGLARGVVAACTVLIPRILVLTAVLNLPVAVSLAPLLLPAFAVGAWLTAFGWRSTGAEPAREAADETNPLRFAAAVRMAFAFQLAMVLIDVVLGRWGSSGVFATAAMLGLSNVDALTVSMSRADAALSADAAARAIAIGILANTVLKMSIALAFGRDAFRRRVGTSLAALTAASGIGLLFA
jgi:uncharacterized membrane protein (DUF4010 family)